MAVQIGQAFVHTKCLSVVSSKLASKLELICKYSV